MPGNSRRRGAVRKTGSKKGPAVGSGGQRRRALEGRGPTPPRVRSPFGAGVPDIPPGFPDLSNMPKGLDELPPGLADIDLSKLKFPKN